MFRPPFPLEDTQAYTLGGHSMIITSFRGTEPVKLRDWLSDATTPPWPGPGGKGYIHYGFGEALESVWPQVRAAVDAFRDNRQTVWFTGHSLGGALAMPAGARLHFEEPHMTANGVYTFGQPRTCDRQLSKEFNTAFSDRMYRFVNNNDIVPQLPRSLPSTMSPPCATSTRRAPSTTPCPCSAACSTAPRASPPISSPAPPTGSGTTSWTHTSTHWRETRTEWGAMAGPVPADPAAPARRRNRPLPLRTGRRPLRTGRLALPSDHGPSRPATGPLPIGHHPLPYGAPHLPTGRRPLRTGRCPVRAAG